MYQKRFGAKRLKPITSRANVPQKFTAPQQKKNNTPFIIGGVIAGVLLIIIILASAGGEEQTQKPKGIKRDFTALIKEAKDYESKGITLYDSVERSAYRSDLSGQEKNEIRSKVVEAMNLMAKAQGIYSEIQMSGGDVPSDARTDLLGQKISNARFVLKEKLE